MYPSELLSALVRRGLTLAAEGADSLRVSPASQLTPDLRELIRENKAGLLELLRPVPFALVNDPADLPAVVEAVTASTWIGLDTETTGLDPRQGRLRLLQLAPDTSPSVYVIDLFALDTAALAPLFGALASARVVIHNAAFDLAFLRPLDLTPRVVHDTLIYSRLLHGTRNPKGFHGLKEVVARELGRPMDKAEQASDWSATLTPDQLAYAAADAAVLVPLCHALRDKLRAAGMSPVAAIERRCVPAVAWLAGNGVTIDRPAWEALTAEAEAEAIRLAAELDVLAPPKPAPAPGAKKSKSDGAWNWNSPKQITEAFGLLGIELTGTGDAVLAALDHPLAAALRKLRAARKLVGTYGAKWLANVADDGRVYADWHQLGSDAGRMSCSGPNLQQLPRDKRYRKCFVAPPGRVLVKADYSQIELRIAAKVSGDEALQEVYRRGDDVHALTARSVLGVEEVSDEQRQLAKVVNFGLLYGMSARTLKSYALTNYGVELTDEQAEEYRAAFFKTYPGLATWHEETHVTNRRYNLGCDGPGESRTLAGRRRLLPRVTRPAGFKGTADEWTKKWNGLVGRQLRERLNSPVQGTGADGLKRALALLWERRAECPSAFPVLAVHDEIVVECDEASAGAAAVWLKRCMVEAMAPLIDPVPVEVDVKIGRSWGECVPVAEWDALTSRTRADSPTEPTRATGPARSEPPPPRHDTPRVGKATGNFEWYTPVEILESARSVLGTFDLDPASCEVAQRNVRAKTYFTEEQDGLSKPWAGRVWMNPPFLNGLIGRFTGKLISHYAAGDVTEAVLLVQNATETRWFQDCMAHAAALCLPSKRMHFLDAEGEPTGRPLQGQALLYFGPNPEAFRATFGPFGACLLTDTSPGEPSPPVTAIGAPASAPPSPPPTAPPRRRRGSATVAPVLKWHGSKSGLAGRIVALMPPHEVYVEPFAGSAAVLLAKPPAADEVLGDLDRDLIRFYRTIRDPEALDRFLALARAKALSWPELPPGPGEPDPIADAFRQGRAALGGPPGGDTVKRALAFFLASRLSMSGRLKNPAPPPKNGRLRRGMDERRSSFLTALDNLPAVSGRLRNARLRHRPAVEVIESEDAPGTLFYLDPPYVKGTRASPEVYRHDGMGEADHRALLELLLTVRGKVMLSGYPSELYDEMLAGWTRHEWPVKNHGATGDKKRHMTELLWCNF
jgi:DNA polymerase-1